MDDRNTLMCRVLGRGRARKGDEEMFGLKLPEMVSMIPQECVGASAVLVLVIVRVTGIGGWLKWVDAHTSPGAVNECWQILT